MFLEIDVLKILQISQENTCVGVSWIKLQALSGTVLVLFNRADLFRLSTFSIWFRMIFFTLFLQVFWPSHLIAFYIHQKLSKHVVLFLMLDCKEYPFIVKEDAQFLHGDILGGQLDSCKVLFVNDYDGLQSHFRNIYLNKFKRL